MVSSADSRWLFTRYQSVYKAIPCQKELHSADFRQEDITDPQLIALAETLVEMPMISTLDLRDSRITDDGARGLLEALRLQIIAAKTPLKTDPKTRMPTIPSVPEYTRYVTQVDMKGNEISASVLQELAQYTEILKREDKRVEIRAALAQIDRNSTGGIDEEESKAVLKLLTGTEPNKKEVKLLMQQHNSQSSGDSSVQKSAVSLENLLLAKCSSSPSKKAARPPWEALVQVRHATLGQSYPSQLGKSKSEYTAEPSYASDGRLAAEAEAMHRSQSQQLPQKMDAPSIQMSSNSSSSSSSSASQYGTQRSSVAGSNAPTANAKLAMAMPPPPPLQIPPTPSQQQQQQSPVSSSSGSSEHGGANAYAKLQADFKPPASPPPPLPLPQTVASPSSASPESRGSVSITGRSFSSSSRESQEFKRGMPLEEFPNEIPFRNLIALILSENGLSILDLLKEVLLLPLWQIIPLSKQCCCGVLITLDGNPIVETDERQKRKSIVYILNLMPMLLSLGSTPCANLHSKEKKKAMVLQGLGTDKSGAAGIPAHGKALLDTNDMFPDFKALWITQACEILQCFQDGEVQSKNRSSSYSNDGDVDQWGDGGSNDDDSDARHPRKPLNKKQQLQKDELRSRAVGYRSQGWPFEVDTPFEPDGEYCVEGEDGEYATDEAPADAGYEDESAHETIEGDQDAEWECEGEHSAIESSQKPLSEFDDDLFSDQDLPTF